MRRGRKNYYTNIVIKTLYVKSILLIKTSTRVGNAPPVWKRAQDQGLKESRLTIRGNKGQCLSVLKSIWQVATIIDIALVKYILMEKRSVSNVNLFYRKSEKNYQILLREKGRDQTQYYDKSPYTNRIVKRAKWQHRQRHKQVRLQSGYGPT